MVGLLGTVLGIPGYLVSRDPWDSTSGGTTRDCPGYTGILSTSWVCDTGVSHVSRDVPSCPGTSRGSTGHPSSGRQGWSRMCVCVLRLLPDRRPAECGLAGRVGPACVCVCCGSSLTGDLPSAVWPAGLVPHVFALWLLRDLFSTIWPDLYALLTLC